MHFIHALAIILVCSSPIYAASPVSKTQYLTSPGQVPNGLGKTEWQGIREAYEAGRHAFHAVTGQEGVWQAHNPGQQWNTTFDQHGFMARPQRGKWVWGLELQSYGFGKNQTLIKGTPLVRASGQRMSYQWNAAVQEWWVNDQRGLEHGFTVSERPQQSGDAVELSLTINSRGTLKPMLSANAQEVLFLDGAGVTVLNYGGLKVWDADGKILPSRFESTGEDHVRLLVDERRARYPITIDPLAQQAYLKASNTEADDFFGVSVAISGDTIVVGAQGEGSNATGVNAALSGASGTQADNSASGAGAVYVFTRSAGVWTQQAYLKASNTREGHNFGRSVAISGDTIVVGASRESSNATGVNAAVSGGSGTQEDNSASVSGAAYVFTRSGGVWSQQAYLKASNTQEGDFFGQRVSISEDTIVVGAAGEDSNATGINAAMDGGSGTQSNNSFAQSGAAYVFTRIDGVWSQQAYLKASNTGEGDWFGDSVTISGDTIVVGADGEDSNATGVNAAVSGGSGSQVDNSVADSGAAYVFTRTAGVWSQQAYLKASNTGADDWFGGYAAISGDTIVVGAYGESSNATGVNAAVNGGSGSQADNSVVASGAAYVFTRSAGVWTQQAYLKASNTEADDWFGDSVTISGDTIVVGADGEDSNATGVDASLSGGLGSQLDNSVADSGAAYVFTRSAGVWTQQTYLKASIVGVGDGFGYPVAISGDRIVVGAMGESSNATGVNASLYGGNGTQVDNSTLRSGATYVFDLLDPAILNQPAAQVTVLGGSATFTIKAVGTGTIKYQWRFNNSNITGATTATLKIAKVLASHEGNYDCIVTGINGSVTSSAAPLSIIAAVAITRQPVGGIFRAGDPVNLSVQVSGTDPVYQWRFKGVAVPGANSDSLSGVATGGAAGNYDVIVSNGASKVTSILASVIVVDPPVITQQPTSLDVSERAQAEFTTAATGTGLTYQWRRNGVNIAAGKTARYSIASAQKATHEGWYDCVVKNSFGTTFTEPVFLGVGMSLNVLVLPRDASVVAGGTATFTATTQTQSTVPVTYQWSLNGTAITGAKSQVLTVTNVNLAKAGIYSVVATIGTLKATGSALLVVSNPGLLIYKLTGTSQDFKGVVSTTSAIAGTLLVDRGHLPPQAATIITGKDGTYNVFSVQQRSNFHVNTTGPAPKAQTIFSESSGNGLTSEIQLWLQGAESLVTLTPTMKTLAAQTLKGSMNSLFSGTLLANPNGGNIIEEAELMSLNAVLDVLNTAIAQQKAETLNEAIKRLSLSLMVNGYAMAKSDVVAAEPPDMALIPAGAFMMGNSVPEDPDITDAPPVSVYVSAFYMAKYEVTKALWDEVRTWGLANGYTDLTQGDGKAADHPVQSISWYDMVKWCNARSEKEGLTPCYTLSSVTYQTGDSDAVTCNWSASGYRLPTEAEWEKAARGGVSGQRFPWGDTITHSQANYSSDASYSYDVSSTRGFHPTYAIDNEPFTSPVGSFAANGYGLYDMVGNIGEWCWDWYSESYYATREALILGTGDPRGPASGGGRIRRGGNWQDPVFFCPDARRYNGGIQASNKSHGLGFRPARIPAK